MFFLVLIYLAFISLGLPDSVLGAAWPLMYGPLGVPLGSAGIISATVAGGTIFSSLMTHRLVGWLGTGRVTVLSVALTALALLGFSFAPSLGWLVLFAIPLGLGAGAVDTGLNEFVAKHYSAKQMNWLHCCWGIGAMLGPVWIASLITAGYTWRTGFLSISGLQLALLALLALSLPVWRWYEAAAASHERHEAAPQRQGLRTSLRLRGVRLAMATLFFVTVVESSFILWGASYLVQARGMLPEKAAGWVALFFLGITGGRVVSGFASIWLGNEALIRIGTFLAALGLGVLLLPLPTSFALVGLLLVGLGLAPVVPAMMHQTPVYFSQGNTQAIIGLQLASAYAASTVMPPLLGLFFARVSFGFMPWVLLFFAFVLIAATQRLALVTREKA